MVLRRGRTKGFVRENWNFISNKQTATSFHARLFRVVTGVIDKIFIRKKNERVFEVMIDQMKGIRVKNM